MSEKSPVIKLLGIIIVVILIIVLVFYTIVSGIIDGIGNFVKKMVNEATTWITDKIKEKKLEATMDVVMVDESHVKALKDQLESVSVDTNVAGLTEVRLRKIILANIVSKSLNSTICLVPVKEEEIVANINERTKNKYTVSDDYLSECQKKSSKNDMIWPVKNINYNLYFDDSEVFFYFQDSDKKFGDSDTQWYLGAMGATKIEGYTCVSKEEFEDKKRLFNEETENTADINMENNIYGQNLLNAYYKSGSDTIVLATITAKQNAYYYEFNNDNFKIEMKSKERDATDKEYKDEKVEYDVKDREIKISDVVDNTNYEIPIELMVNFLNMTGSGQFLEDFIDYALEEIKITIAAKSTTCESYTYSKDEYNINGNFIIEAYDMADTGKIERVDGGVKIGNTTWNWEKIIALLGVSENPTEEEIQAQIDILNAGNNGGDNFIAYKDIIFNRMYNGSKFYDTVTKLNNFEDITMQNAYIKIPGKSEDRQVKVRPLKVYLKNAYEPGTGFSLGTIKVTEGKVEIQKEINAEFVPVAINTWYGDITYTGTVFETNYISSASGGEISEEDFNKFGYDKVNSPTKVSDEEKIRIYLSRENANQGSINENDDITILESKSEDFLDDAFNTKPGKENKPHFSNWNIKGLVGIASNDKGEFNDDLGAGKGCDYIYTKFKKTDYNRYAPEVVIKNNTVDTSNVEKKMCNVDDKLKKFLRLLKNETGKRPKVDQNAGEFSQDGTVVRYGDIYDGTIPAGDLLLDNGALMLFKLLEVSDKTQTLVNVFKYMAYLYSGVDHGITNVSDLEYIFELSNISGIYGDSIEEKLWFALKDAKLSDYAAAGAMGNLYAESAGFKSNNLEDKFESILGYTDITYTQAIDNGTYSMEKFISDHTKQNCGAGYGIAQWTWCTRKEGLYKYCKSKGVSISDENSQVEYLIAEITGEGPASAYATINTSDYKGYTVADWKEAKSVEEATNAFCWIFEKPASEDANMDKRISMAKNYYSTLEGETKPASGNINGTFLQVAEQCHEYLRINNYYYGHGATIPLDAKRSTFADCSSYVSWALYEYGYKDFAGAQHVCKDFINNKDNYIKKYGWEYRSAEKAVAGDIIVRSDHMEIYAGDGRYLNAGTTDAMRRKLTGGKWGTDYLSGFKYAITIPKK